MDELNEREFELVNIVGAELANNQRDLSQHMDLSLGTINMLIRRLVSKGYIRIRQLNSRKVQYILTPKGFAEKMQKSVKYTMKTISSIGLIRSNIEEVIKELRDQGYRSFFILGQSDLTLLVESAIYSLGIEDTSIEYIEKNKKQGSGVLLICEENVDSQEYHFDRCVDVISELAKDESFVNHNHMR